MTIYLSRGWRPDFGGYFCWKDWDSNFPRGSYTCAPLEATMRLPTYNAYVHISEAEWHTTTLTLPTAPPRLSLQLFFSSRTDET